MDATVFKISCHIYSPSHHCLTSKHRQSFNHSDCSITPLLFLSGNKSRVKFMPELAIGLYLVSGRVSDMLDIKENQIIDNAIHYQASKNNQPVIVEMDNELHDLVTWFQKYKKKQNIISRFLIVHPKTAPRGQATKPITAKRLYIYFKKASKILRFTKYHLRHLRAKALTDEVILAGSATNKGAHRTELMRQQYVKKKVPVVVQNNIKRIK